MVIAPLPAAVLPAFSYILPAITGFDDLITLISYKFWIKYMFFMDYAGSKHVPWGRQAGLLTELQ
jgi:hypothetical protein